MGGAERQDARACADGNQGKRAIPEYPDVLRFLDAESGRHGVAGDSGGFDRGGHEQSENLRNAAGMPRRRVRQGWQGDAVAEGNPHRDDYVQITTKIFREVLTSGGTFGIITPVADKECCYFQIHLKITESHSG